VRGFFCVRDQQLMRKPSEDQDEQANSTDGCSSDDDT